MSNRSTRTRSNRSVRLSGYVLFNVLLASFASMPALAVGADSDGDGYADLIDYLRFQRCLARSDGATLPAECTIVDANGDSRLNLRDVAEIQNGFDVSVCPGALFSPEAFPNPGQAIWEFAIGDVDGDGDLDALTKGSGGSFEVLFRDGYGTYRHRESTQMEGLESHAYLSSGDCDSDGDVDVLLIDFLQKMRVHLNDGTGRFDYVCGESPLISVFEGSFIDMDADGINELIGTTYDGLVIVPILGTCQFGNPTLVPLSVGGAKYRIADVNQDAYMDLVAFDIYQPFVAIQLATGIGTFVETAVIDAGGGVRSIEIGDADEDGRVDLIIGTWDEVRLATGYGDGTFSSPTTVAQVLGNNIIDIDFGDIDGDGHLDIADLGESFSAVLRGRGDGNFDVVQTYRIGRKLGEAYLADLNSDGFLDWLANSTYGWIAVLYGNENGDFGGPVGSMTPIMLFSLHAVDLNRDGRDDVLSVDDDTDTLYVVFAESDGRFAWPITYPTGNEPRTVMSGDWGSDGVTEVIVEYWDDDLLTIFQSDELGTLSFISDYSPSTSLRLVGFADADLDGRDEVIATSGDTILALALNGEQVVEVKSWIVPELDPPFQLVYVVDLNGDPYVDFLLGDDEPCTAGFITLAGTAEGNPVVTFVGDCSTGFSDGYVLPVDLNLDGVMDIVHGKPSTLEVFVYLGNGDGTFADPYLRSTGAIERKFVTGDFNGDGLPDVMASTGSGHSPGSVSLLTGDGHGNLSTGRRYLESYGLFGFATGDFDGDGTDDVVISQWNPDRLLVYLSQCSIP